jgi:hypothetical protein
MNFAFAEAALPLLRGPQCAAQVEGAAASAEWVVDPVSRPWFGEA